MVLLKNGYLLHKLNLISKTNRLYSNLSYKHHLGSEPLLNLTIGKLLEKTANKFAERNAIISIKQNKSITFKNLLKEADKFAAGLRSLGLVEGDRVGIWAPNLIEWEISLMACARGGFVGVQINPAYQMQEIEYCINKVGIKSLICVDHLKKQNYYEMLNVIAGLDRCEPGKLNSDKVPSLKSIIMITDDTHKGVHNFNEILELPTANDIKLIENNQDKIDCDSGCHLQFTSGTTGHPKAALLSHSNIVNNSYNLGKRMGLDKQAHKICLQVPFFHAFGTTIAIMGALNHGATMVLPDVTYNPPKSLDAIVNEKCTLIFGTPTMYVDLINLQKQRKELINPQMAVCGGAPCSPALFSDMLDILKVKNVMSVFGMTETSAVIFQSFPNDVKDNVLNTVGHVSNHCEVKVIDQNNKILPFGQPGELCVRGYVNMLGYWGDDAKTREIIGPDGWLKTGDIFILYENGYGKIVGRNKDMIIRGGENIFPKEIEDFLNTHPSILEAHVVGLPHERLGEEVCACVRLEPNTKLNLDDIKAFSKGQISDFKIPSRLVLLDSFPKTVSGKIQKFKIVNALLKK